MGSDAADQDVDDKTVVNDALSVISSTDRGAGSFLPAQAKSHLEVDGNYAM